MILVDTSVWVDHLRRGNAGLVGLLDKDHVVCHPFVIGELACGRLKNRDEILALLAALASTEVVEQAEALSFLHTHDLAGTGLGWIDVHLLASAAVSHTALWTLDKALAAAARRLRVAH